ncbi:XdhC family protein [Candidatus Agathobaculum pullicola]|uniref:XdhC family protein n=1 Tax=Candidatus Agathobaculum pullicola TaxID=2838426 RepID=UPI003F91CDCD
MFEQLLITALQEIEADRPVLLVSVARATGSTPRKEGAILLAGTQGLLCGTIGGGLLEHRCLELAAAQPACGHLEHFELDNRKAGSLGMVCGGSTEVLFTPLHDTAPLREALTALHDRTPVCLCLPLDGSAPHIAQDGALPVRPSVLSLHGKDALCVPLADAGRVFVIGGGHVSHELCTLLHRLDFRHVVIDDRADFCCPARFPHAEHTLTVPLTELAASLVGALCPTEADAFCIMTRGHQGDADAVRYALSTPASYIGLMGSRRKRETLFHTLTQEGFSSEAQQRIVTPIGLEIGAQTPAEIAVSIAAQLIAWRTAR